MVNTLYWRQRDSDECECTVDRGCDRGIRISARPREGKSMGILITLLLVLLGVYQMGRDSNNRG